MSYLQKLLDKYCPDGYEWVQLQEAVEIFDNKRIPIAQNKRIKGKFPYYGANGIQDYVNDFIFDGEYILIGEDGSVIDELNHPILNYATGKFWVNNHAHVLKAKEEFLNRFIYHFLSILDISDIVRGTPPKMTKGNLLTISIPKIPLKIQEKIVEILERFRILEAELKAELKAELEARGKQFCFWKKKLFKSIVKKANFMRLDELINTHNGYTPSKNNNEFWNKKEISWFTLKDFKNKKYKFYDSDEYISQKGARKIFKSDSLILSTTATIGEIAIVKKDFVCNQQFTILSIKDELTSKLSSSYLYYLIKENMDHIISKTLKSSSFSSIDVNRFKKIKIPIPPIETQNKIVSILDKLSEYSQEINSGLPAEIELRSKQFKYYRDQLLDFK